MDSKIKTDNINEKYPEPGKDNDTGGFRDNFSEIKNNLNIAQSEITDLLVNSARTDKASDFNGNTVKDINLEATTQQVYDLGSKNSDFTIDFSLAHYYIVDVTNSVTITLTNWPQDGRYAKLYVSVTNSSQQSATITWLTEQSGQIKKKQGNTIELYDSTDGFDTNIGAFPDPFIVSPTTNEHLVEFWTVNNGVTVFADYKGQYV